MAIYRVKLAGRSKPILLRAKNKTEAIDRVVVEIGALTGDAVEDAIDKGETVWKPGDELPADDVKVDAPDLEPEA